MVSGKELVVINICCNELLKKHTLYDSLSIAFQDEQEDGRELY